MASSDGPFADWHEIIVWGCDWLSSQIPPEVSSTSAATMPPTPTPVADNVTSPIPPATDSKDKPAEGMPHPSAELPATTSPFAATKALLRPNEVSSSRAAIPLPIPSALGRTEVAPNPLSTPAIAFPLPTTESDVVPSIAGTRRKADKASDDWSHSKRSRLETMRVAERIHPPAQPQAGPSRLIEAYEGSKGNALEPHNSTTGASSFMEDFQASGPAPVNVQLWGQGPIPTQTSLVGQPTLFSASTLSLLPTSFSSLSTGSSAPHISQMTLPSVPMPSSRSAFSTPDPSQSSSATTNQSMNGSRYNDHGVTFSAPPVSLPAPSTFYPASHSFPSVSTVNITPEMLLVAQERASLFPPVPMRNGQTSYNSGPFNCHICILGFRTKRELTTHNRRQTHARRVLVLNGYRTLPPKDFPCDYPECDKEYSNRSSLVTHRKIAHGIGGQGGAMSLPVADLKSKAVKAKDASVSKLSTTRDRMKSTPSAQTGFDPYAKRTPPPPPPLRSTSSRSAESSSSASVSARPPPPPVHRTSRPDAAPPPVLSRRRPSTVDHGSSSVRAYGDEQQRESADRIDWSNLSTEDKQALFSWLDEFFSRYLGRPVGPIKAGVHPISGFAGSETLSASWRRTLPPPLAPLTGPPKPNLSTKPLPASFENM
ncbi:hypothetical protein HETIRDRAFT_103639 [Heterobasidion irregulare TC 32-1]|uniref:C2H2-type domain-containing protein n=1 Tax=Heterobasidion irregulare (strain TC 32-1) TaxID=747525 RepID=W4K3X6_HETIT|nr:uncharacterized protein HETIRDRAFT_103639 [Heterobasidion irregulare TC 32-1]ETW79761.1 hypothetical protein HETIRDRAFT_103639 [Heterobasidion irregulare TC 32-1]